MTPSIIPELIMRTVYALLFSVICLFSACERVNLNPESEYRNVCQTNNPMEELAWLKEMAQQNASFTDMGCYMTVHSGLYNNQPVFMILIGGPACCGCSEAVYNCQGQLLFFCDAKLSAKIQEVKFIWWNYP
jgi:hypothetical protein